MQYLTKFLRESLTLQYHSDLNPKFWVNIFLKEEVRKKLLEISKEWLKFAEIPNSAVKDIVFTGGNANYNYTEDSDIDVHIILDKSKIPNCSDEEYFKDKKLIWSLTHDISIYGAEIEVYAQLGEVNIPKNQGVYSLKTGKWVVKPENLELDFEHDDLLKKKIDDAIYQIDHALQNTTDTKAAEKLLEKFQKLRKHAIAKNGEFTQDNLIFKELRNRGYLDKIREFIVKLTDKRLSI
jgi:hypothetical protein